MPHQLIRYQINCQLCWGRESGGLSPPPLFPLLSSSFLRPQSAHVDLCSLVVVCKYTVYSYRFHKRRGWIAAGMHGPTRDNIALSDDIHTLHGSICSSVDLGLRVGTRTITESETQFSNPNLHTDLAYWSELQKTTKYTYTCSPLYVLHINNPRCF